MKNVFAVMFLLAMILLLSGLVQSKDRVELKTYTIALDNSPPLTMPAIDLQTNNPAVIWLCTSMPGVQDQGSSNVAYLTGEDMLSMNYININRHSLNIKNRFVSYNIDQYRKPRDGLRQS
jgi:hypothetical protein